MDNKNSISRQIARDIPLPIAERKDIPAIAAMFTAAFSEDVLTRYLLSAAREPETVIYDNFRLLLERVKNGVLFKTSTECEGAALWYLDENPRGHFSANLRVLAYKLRQFPLKDIGVLLPFFLRMEKAHHRIIKRPHFYLELLGVHPDHQGRGFSSRLLRPVLARADDMGRSCYLETESAENIAIYEHFGFKVVKRLPANFSEDVFSLMLRRPVKG